MKKSLKKSQIRLDLVILSVSLLGAFWIINSNFRAHTTQTQFSQSVSSRQSVMDPGQKFINAIPLQESEKVGWKKYVNSKQGYSIDFPVSYTSDVGIANELVLYNNGVDEGMATPSTLRISITGPESVQENGEYDSLKEYIAYGQSVDSGIGPISWTQINGYEVAIEKGISRYYFFNNGHVYYIDARLFEAQLEDELLEILSTFRLLD